MESRAKLFGHSIHQQLIVIPLGAFTIAAIYDLVYIFTGAAGAALTAFWVIAAGIVGGAVAAIFGVIDWWAIPSNTRAKQVGLRHAVTNVFTLAVFIAAWLWRLPLDHRAPPELAAWLSVVGLALGGIGGWLGGELVARLGVGVTPGAHVDAPSSLSNEPVVAPRREAAG